MRQSHLMFGLIFVFIAGCASHRAMRGSVAMKINANEAHVCLGNGEVKAGDRVALFEDRCTTTDNKIGPQAPVCQKTKIGEGKVKSILNEHYSVVEVDPGVSFKEGTVVEKIQK